MLFLFLSLLTALNFNVRLRKFYRSVDTSQRLCDYLSDGHFRCGKKFSLRGVKDDWSDLGNPTSTLHRAGNWGSECLGLLTF